MHFLKTLLFLLVVNSEFLVCTAEIYVSSDFAHQPRFDDVYLPTIHLMATHSSVTLLWCVVICKNVPGCSSVRYHVTERECHLLNFCLICNIGKTEMAWRYFCQNQPPTILYDHTKERIAFHTYSGDAVKGYGDHLIFNKILTNVGQGYNSTSGIFTSPRDGLYILPWNQQSKNYNHYTTTFLFGRGQPVRKLQSRFGNPASDFVMIRLRVGDSAYVCSDYRNTFIGATSQFSGWIYEESEDSCDVLFHGIAKNDNENATLFYESSLIPRKIYSELTTESNGTCVLMSQTGANRGKLSYVRYVINENDVMNSVIDGRPENDVDVSLVTVQKINNKTSI